MIVAKKGSLPETLPEMGAVRPTTNLVESDESGLQPIDRAWEEGARLDALRVRAR